MVTSELIGFEQRVPHLHGFTDARADPREMFLGGKDLLGDAFTNNIIKHIVPSCPALVNIRLAKQAIPINVVKHIAGFRIVTK